MSNLALYGGKPVRAARLSYGHQYIDRDDIQAVTEVLKSDFLTCGPKVSELETALCSLTGAAHCTAVSNGTAALHVACLAAGIGPGDEVITTPITFAASSNAILYCGGTPVFADVDSKTYTINPETIERCVTERTKAIIAVDFTGAPCDYNGIRAVCEKHRLLLIEDAAHSIGTAYRGTPVGSIADLTTFSFHPVKTITAGEGGAVLTNDDTLAKRVELFARHGITRDPALLQAQGNSNWYYEQQMLGYNYRMTDIQCALALSQLKKLDRFAARRKELVRRYDEAFKEIPEVIVQTEVEGSDTVRHLYILRLKLDRLNCGRKEFYDAMQAENIGVNVHYIPVYWFPYYQSLGYRKGLCSNAEAYYESSMTLPLFYGMTDEDQDDVIRAVKKLVEYFRN
ncbi:UDP-4-amino-4,6-dideoxy-N-acetyl-beta-L-altrosamine transaminase [Flintibacter muris]|uniref:UDP-4-amino-4, 6-dideoxy-N-acetyl-beta-L-altrosamine transaminase n=1 Tax=Flintibacter muris TaxID=2941327 RepID=UPI00203E942A|nr:UDP-4-amino-4,6-dideoxy-N-acetyl-beta-L-altrosamine transaminase [Flintibacter muris]